MQQSQHSEINIVVIEDNETMRLGMQESLQRDGYNVAAFSTGPAALAFVAKNEVHIIVTDLKMAPMDGLAVLREVKQNYPAVEIILVSAFGTVETAVKAMQEGAADFLTKPFSPQELRVRVKKILQKIIHRRQLNKLSAENQYLRQLADAPYENMIGRSPQIKNIFKLIEKIAAEKSTVLIQGESGTGKELVARAIHRRGTRATHPFICVNAAALSENLLESELFGHEKGAFTGANRQKRGRFELADGGTIFLDEIGDISPALQVKLLRVLQEQRFERLGGEKSIRTDARVIAATNQNLAQLVEAGKFREDLFYRINVFPILLPPLRERREDIPLLAAHFLKRNAAGRNTVAKTIANEGLAALTNYNWPGNIRELENFMERLSVTCPETEISALRIQQMLQPASEMPFSDTEIKLDQLLFNYEKQLIETALRECGGIKNRAAKILGIKTSALYYKLDKFGLL